jgi:ABC-type uncharacterized transport system permease subunit
MGHWGSLKSAKTFLMELKLLISIRKWPFPIDFQPITIPHGYTGSLGPSERRRDLTVDYIFSTIGLISYAIASLCYLIAFKGRSLGGLRGKAALGFLVVATAATIASLLARPEGIDPAHEAGPLLVALMSLLTIVGHVVYKLPTVSAFIAPLATLTLLLQLSLKSGVPPGAVSGYPKKFLMVHVTLSILGQAFAICAAGFGGVYLRQQRSLKMKLLDELSEGPALDRVEWLLQASLWVGFVFITSGLISGALFTQYWGSPEPYWNKLLWSVAVWLWYLITLSCRMVFAVPMRVIARMSFAGFLLLATMFFGIQGVIPPGQGGP